MQSEELLALSASFSAGDSEVGLVPGVPAWVSPVPSHRDVSVQPCHLGLTPVTEGRLGLCSRQRVLSVHVDVNRGLS